MKIVFEITIKQRNQDREHKHIDQTIVTRILTVICLKKKTTETKREQQ